MQEAYCASAPPGTELPLASSLAVVVVPPARLATPPLGELPQPAASNESAASATTETTMTGRRRNTLGLLSAGTGFISPLEAERLGRKSWTVLRASLGAAD